MTTPSLGGALTRVVYLTIPVVIDGSKVTVDLTDDGEPGSWGTMWMYDESYQGGGYWTNPSAEDLTSAWDLVADKLKEVTDGS